LPSVAFSEKPLRSAVVLGKGLIEATVIVRFYGIPEEILNLEHDCYCTDLYHLHSAMKEIYRDAVDASSFVTVVFFSTQEARDEDAYADIHTE
jgi:hypothetical protein